MMNPNPFAWSFRAQCLAGAVLCFSLIGYALYVQEVLMMMPCPLCILQRIAFAGMGFFFLVGAAHNPKDAGWRRAWSGLAFLFALAGGAVAARHLWLQSLPPDQVPMCTGMGIDYLLEAFGPLQALQTILRGSGECAQVDWTFLGLSMPSWTLVWYAGLGFGALWAGWRRR
jgi:disulfide bond formation protein DsbB